ncbi:MAG: hypothetical protein WBB45_06785 [Cyclobacteriaceae bacterium]
MLAYISHIVFPICLLISSLTAGSNAMSGTKGYEADRCSREVLADRPAVQYSRSLSGEEVRLHVPISELEAGDTLFFSAYVLDKEYDAPSERSLTLYAYLVDSAGHPADGSAFYLEDGRVSGYFPLSETLPDGRYNLVAFTARQQQFSPEEVSAHRLTIGVETGKADKPTIRFMPEGGNIVAGIPARISFYCAQPDRIDWQQGGTVYDNQGRQVANITAGTSGTGEFRFIPYQSDYSVVLHDRQGHELTYQLPPTRHRGATLHLAQMRGDSVARLAVHFSHPHLYPRAHLAAVQNGNMLINEDFTPGRQNYYDIPVGQLSPGDLHFGVWDHEGHLLSGLDLSLPAVVERDLEVTSAMLPAAKGGQIMVATPEGEAVKGHFTLTVRPEQKPGYRTLREVSAADPIAFWQQVKKQEEAGNDLVDYETCRLVLVNKRGKPVPGQQVKVVDGEYTSALRTAGDGSMRLPNYRLLKPLTFLLPDKSYSLLVADTGAEDFIYSVGKNLSGTDHGKCVHTSHSRSFSNHVKVARTQGSEWMLCKYRHVDRAVTSVHRNSAIYWQLDATPDKEGRLTFDLPAEWEGRPLHIQLAGFTEDGYYLDRQLLVN